MGLRGAGEVFMKKIYFLLLLIPFFSSCASVRNLNNYDPVTYEKNDHIGKEILGSVKVSTLGFTWTSLTPFSNRTVKLMDRLEDKAIKTYGEYIDIIDVELGGMDGLTTTLLWGAGGALFSGSALVNSYFTDEVTERGKRKTVVTNEIGYNVSMGVAGSSLLFFLFKGIKASAIVIKSDTPYKRGNYKLVSEDEIYEKQNKYYSNKNEIDLEQKESKRNADLKKNQKLYNNLKNQLILRGKEVNSPIVILDSGITDINSAEGVSCYVDFINISDKLAKYVNIDLVPYNRVFDQAYSHIDGSSEKTVNITNFIGPNEEYSAAWDNVWYNSTILTMKISKVEMIFTDNTKLVIDNPDEIEKIFFTSDEYSQYKDLKEKIEIFNK